MTQSLGFHEMLNHECFALTLDGLDEWGDDAVLNQVLAVSQHEYLNSLMQQQQQQQGDTQNKVIKKVTKLLK
jgi:hypothetical protein